MCLKENMADPSTMTQNQRQALWDRAGHAGIAPVGYGGESSGGSSGGGTDTIDLSSVPSSQEFTKSQFATEDVALQALLERMKAQQSPEQIYKRYETEAGLPELRLSSKTLSSQIADLEDFLDQVEPGISAKSRESLLTEAQRQGLVAETKRPWLEKLSKFGTALGRIQEGIASGERTAGTYTSLILEGQKLALEPYQFEYSVLVDRHARLQNSWDKEKEVLLDSLYDKLKQNRFLENREWEQVNTLAQGENAYYKTLQQQAASAGISLQGSESAGQILALIGQTAKREADWEKAYKSKTAGGTGTATERSTAAALVSLRNDIKNYSTYDDLVRRYGSILPTYQIRDEYNAFQTTGGWGPAKESEKVTQGIKSGDYDRIAGNVRSLMSQNASKSEIETYINGEGYSSSDFQSVIGNYTQTQTKSSWWPF